MDLHPQDNYALKTSQKTQSNLTLIWNGGSCSTLVLLIPAHCNVNVLNVFSHVEKKNMELPLVHLLNDFLC